MCAHAQASIMCECTCGDQRKQLLGGVNISLLMCKPRELNLGNQADCRCLYPLTLLAGLFRVLTWISPYTAGWP